MTAEQLLIHLMQDAVHNNGILLYFRIELRHPAEAQDLLCLRQRCAKTDTKTDHPVSGRFSPSGKKLVQIDFTGCGALSQ